MSNLSPAAILFDSSGVEKGTGSNPVTVNGDLLVTNAAARDVFGAGVSAVRYNQVEIDYSTTAPASITDITVTATSGGSSANSSGQAVFSTGTSTTGGIKAVTNLTVNYRPHAEIYAAFTCVFTTGVANSYQRIGIYDTNNGFFVGYEGTSFGVTIRKAGVDTTTARASFSEDTLTGGASSKYTRNGVPETMDPTKDQLYRIRYGWLGAAPIYYEILSPDGEWVTFHIIRHPNTTTDTTVNNPDLPITLDAQKTSGATNITMSTACWAGGSTSNFQKVSDTITSNTLASLSRSVITGVTTGGGGGYVNVKVDPSGALNVAATQGTSPWVVSGTVTANLGTIDGVATETTLSALNTKTPALGAAAKAAATPVTIATDDTGTISTANSTTTPLSGSATFTGTWEDISQQASISIIISTDQTGTMYAEFSSDGTNVDRTVQLSAGTDNPSNIHGLIPVARYLRVRLVNGATPQTYLRIQTILNRQGRVTLPVSRMSQTLGDYSDVVNTRAGVFGKYQASPATLTDGQRGDLLLDNNGRVVTSTAAAVRDSSTAAIGANASYTTPSFDTINGQNYLSYSAYSATDLLIIFQESSDNTNWSNVDYYACAAGDSSYSCHRITGRYGRIVFQNGNVANAGGVANLNLLTALTTNGNETDVVLADRFGRTLLSDKVWGLNVKTPGDVTTYGNAVTHQRVSQTTADFTQPYSNSDVTIVTATGSGSVGATPTNGQVVISSGTTAASTAGFFSNALLAPDPGHEAYAEFACRFTTTTASSTQRIGLYDANNGFILGNNGTSFGLWWRQNAVDTFVAASAFSDDLLSGNINSRFTRNGTPEAIDWTKLNTFRIRYGAGAEAVQFEVLSPDGNWVRFHVLRGGNALTAPYVYSSRVPLQVAVAKTAGATDIVIGLLFWDMGTVTDTMSLDYSGTLNVASATATNPPAGSVVTVNTDAKATVSFNVVLAAYTGTIVLEGHNGDLAWATLTGYTAAGAPLTGITGTATTSTTFFVVNCAAYSQVRLRCSAFTSGTATVTANATTAPVSVFTQTEGNSAALVADTGNPLKIGGVGKTTQPTAATDGQRTNILTDKLGRVVVAPGHIRDLVAQQTTTIANSAAETTIFTATAATFNDLSSLVITNSGNTGTTVTIRDATAGTTRAIYYVPAQGGLVFNPAIPWKQSAVNNNWTAQLSSATVTVYFHAIAVQNI